MSFYSIPSAETSRTAIGGNASDEALLDKKEKQDVPGSPGPSDNMSTTRPVAKRLGESHSMISRLPPHLATPSSSDRSSAPSAAGSAHLRESLNSKQNEDRFSSPSTLGNTKSDWPAADSMSKLQDMMSERQKTRTDFSKVSSRSADNGPTRTLQSDIAHLPVAPRQGYPILEEWDNRPAMNSGGFRFPAQKSSFDTNKEQLEDLRRAFQGSGVKHSGRFSFLQKEKNRRGEGLKEKEVASSTKQSALESRTDHTVAGTSAPRQELRKRSGFGIGSWKRSSRGTEQQGEEAVGETFPIGSPRDRVQGEESDVEGGG